MQETITKASDLCWLLCFLDTFLRQVHFMYLHTSTSSPRCESWLHCWNVVCDVGLWVYLAFVTFRELDIPTVLCLWYTERDLEQNGYTICHFWGILNCGFSENVCIHTCPSDMYLVCMIVHTLGTLQHHSVWDIVIYMIFQELDILLKCFRNIVIFITVDCTFDSPCLSDIWPADQF
jgi:hypothetical protein